MKMNSTKILYIVKRLKAWLSVSCPTHPQECLENFALYGIGPIVYMPVVTMSCSHTALATGHTLGSSAQPVSIALQKLMDKYQLTTFQIDREIQQKDVLYLAAWFDNVEYYVDAMELSPGEHSDARKTESNHLAMIMCLKIWKSKKLSQATFRALLEMLVKLKKGEIADNVCHYIKVSVCVCLNLYFEPNLTSIV